jgi:hypothetical protein
VNGIRLGAGVVTALLIGLVVALTAGGNTDSTTTTVAPATTTAAPTTTTTSATTTSAAPTTSTTTTRPPTTTTTLSLEEREAEVLALVTEIEFRLWDADYRLDVDELEDLIGGEELFERWTGTPDPRSFYSRPPDRGNLSVELYAIELDRPDCLVVAIAEDPSAFLKDGTPEDLIVVLWPVPEAQLKWRIVERFGGGTPESSWLPQCDLQNREWRP